MNAPIFLKNIGAIVSGLSIVLLAFLFVYIMVNLTYDSLKDGDYIVGVPLLLMLCIVVGAILFTMGEHLDQHRGPKQ